MNKYTAYKGWGLPYPLLHSGATCTTISGQSCILRLILGISVVALTPALSCSTTDNLQPSALMELNYGTKAQELAVTSGPEHEMIRTLDILIFGTDSLQRLESYQRFEAPAADRIFLATTAGDKQVFACANSRYEAEDWMKVNSVYGLEDFCVELESERRDFPTMSGACSISAGETSGGVLSMRRLTCEIVLNSIRCDFRGKPYEGEPMQDARIYLINVNAQSRIFDDSDGKPLKIVNVGSMNVADTDKFEEPDLIVQDLTARIGEEALFPGISLRCCPNHGTEESPGSPFTRLVIEGKVQGETYYWAVTVNRDEGSGIESACRYIYDITIRRKGSRDPDSPASIEDIGFIYKETEWEEKEPYTVFF